MTFSPNFLAPPVVGPIVSGLLNDHYGFNSTYDYISGGTLVYLLLYMLIWGGFASIGRSFVNSLWKRNKAKDKHFVLLENENENEEIASEHETFNGLAHLQTKDISTDGISLKTSDNGNLSKRFDTVMTESNSEQFSLYPKRDTSL